MKLWYQSRTVWLSVATLLVAVLTAPEVLPIIPDGWMRYITAVVAVLGIVLRLATTQPIGKDTPPQQDGGGT